MPPQPPPPNQKGKGEAADSARSPPRSVPPSLPPKQALLPPAATRGGCCVCREARVCSNLRSSSFHSFSGSAQTKTDFLLHSWQGWRGDSSGSCGEVVEGRSRLCRQQVRSPPTHTHTPVAAAGSVPGRGAGGTRDARSISSTGDGREGGRQGRAEQGEAPQGAGAAASGLPSHRLPDGLGPLQGAFKAREVPRGLPTSFLRTATWDFPPGAPPPNPLCF